MPKVLFVRHGETDHNVTGFISACPPGPSLTPRGARQVEALARGLDRSVGAVYTSPLRRARETAEALADALGLAPVVRDELAECGVGALEGATGDEAFARFNDVWGRWTNGDDLDSPMAEGGETASTVVGRLATFLAAVCADHAADEVVVAVSHLSIIQLGVTRLADNVDPRLCRCLPVPNTGIVVIDCSPGSVSCVDWCGIDPHDFARVATPDVKR